MKKTVTLGKIVGVYGIRGYVKVLSYTDPMDNLFSYDQWVLRQGNQVKPIQVKSWRHQGKGFIAQLVGYEDRDLSRTLTGGLVQVDRSQLPALEPGDYYWSDLIGLQVENTEGVVLGHITSLLETGAHDVLVVKRLGETEPHQTMIPFVPDIYVMNISLDAGQMIVDWHPDD